VRNFLYFIQLNKIERYSSNVLSQIVFINMEGKIVSISAIKQDYIVKSVLFISFLFVMSLGLIGGCSDGGRVNDLEALTENDFAEDSALRAELDEGVVVTFLESPMSDEAENDTGDVGEDDIPVIYEETTEQTFCWEDDDAGAMHFMELIDSEGSVVLTVHVNGDCVTWVIEEGNYIISIHHDESIGDALPIFLIPNVEELEQARETDGFIDRFKLVASNVLKQIEKTVTKDAQAQVVEVNRDTLLSTGRCLLCELRKANLRDAKLSGVKLSGAKLSGADLSGADLSGADLNFADLSEAFLINANLSSALLTGADFSKAIWCDGRCVCGSVGSIGTCNRCAPVEEVCTGPEN
jgi:hypothetical protein